MQINFFMGEMDRKYFHDYIFSRGGYLTPEYWEKTEIPIANLENPIDINCWGLKIFKEDNFSSVHFSNSNWIKYHEPTKKFYIHGPGMEYLKSYTNDREQIRGRIYMGLVGEFSYIEPGKQDPLAYEKHKDAYKQLENFYKSCCRYIRKNFRKDDTGFYHGAHSDELEKNGVIKRQIQSH